MACIRCFLHLYFLLHRFSFGNYTALYQTILNSVNLILHFLFSVTFKHSHLTFFVFTKMYPIPNNIPCNYTSPPFTFLKLSHQPDFTLETFTFLFVLHLVIQHQSLLSTQLNNAFHSQLIKLFSLLCIACFEVATNGYRPKFESKSNKSNSRITCKRLDLIKQLQFNNNFFSPFTSLQNTCQCLKMDQF